MALPFLRVELSNGRVRPTASPEAPRLRKLGRSTPPPSVSRLSKPCLACQQSDQLLALRPGFHCCTSQYVCRAGWHPSRIQHVEKGLSSRNCTVAEHPSNKGTLMLERDQYSVKST